MSWAHIRLRDELRKLPLWMLVTLANLSVMLGLDMAIALDHDAFIPGWALILSGWIGLAAYILVGAKRERCGSFDLTLPLSARTVWWIHVAGRTGAVVVLAGIAAAAMAFVAERSAATMHWGGHPAVLLADLVAGGSLAVMLLELQSPKLQRPPAGRRRTLWALTVVVVIPALLIVLSGTGVAGAVVLLVAAGALAWGIHRILPQSFLVQPDAAQEDRKTTIAGTGTVATAVPQPGSVAAMASGRVAWRTLAGSLSGGNKDWFMLPALVLIGAALGGLLTAWTGDPDLDNLRVTYVPLVSYMLFTAVLIRLRRLHTLDPLPISRRRMFAVLVLPLVALSCLGFAATLLGIVRFGSRIELVDYRSWNDRQPPHIIVPSAYLAFADAGKVPAVDAPWGESHEPLASPVFLRSRHVLYSPYDAPPGSSIRFVALQISRAAEAVYGVHIAPESIAERELEETADGRILPRGGRLHLRSEFEALHPRTGGSYLGILLFAALASWLLAMALLFTGYRPTVPQRTRQLAVTAYVLLFVAGMLGFTAAMVKRVVHPAATNAALAVVGRHLDASWGSAAMFWIVGVGLTALAYALAQRQFQRMEIPPHPTQYSLLDRMACEP